MPDTEIKQRNEKRVLVLAPFGRDAELICELLQRHDLLAFRCKTLDDLLEGVRQGAAAAIVAEEVLTREGVVALAGFMHSQPTWSDFPLLLLTVAGEVTRLSQNRRVLREPLGNVLLLERPVRPETLLSTMNNVLRSRQRQYQIRDQIEQYQLAADALRRSEKLAVAGRLAASIAHEINNPLEAVTNLIYLLRSTPQNEEAQKYLRMAEQELARVSAIATQTLKFYRDTAKPTEVSVQDLLESVLTLYGPRLASADIRVQREFVATQSIVAKAGEIRQLFANLIGNALDAMRAGGTLRLRVSHVSHDAEATFVRISIGDTGTGIPRELRRKVFEPFVSTKGDTGTGLGLWVTKEIVDNHCGKIRVRSSTSSSRHGTVFSVYLPTQRVADAVA